MQPLVDDCLRLVISANELVERTGLDVEGAVGVINMNVRMHTNSAAMKDYNQRPCPTKGPVHREHMYPLDYGALRRIV